MALSARKLQKQHNLSGNFAIVSPVHWHASHNDALITAIEHDLGASEQELQQQFALLRDFVRADNMELVWHSPYLWLLRIDGKPQLTAKPINKVLNRSLMPELAALDAKLYWQKFLTECQMLFASVPNHTLVNGVWIWGNKISLWSKLFHAN